MSGLKVLTASAVILMSTSAFADIRVIETNDGAWVTVTENGMPVESAQVSVANVPTQRGTFQTDESGRVFIPLNLERSRSVKFQAKTEEGKTQERYAYQQKK